MQYTNQILPDKIEETQAHLQTDVSGPIAIINLLKFKPQAQYDDGRQTTLTGEQAYALYIDAVREELPTLGARVIYQGMPNFLLVGKVEEIWDRVLIIEYPSRQALMALSQTTAVQAASLHRSAGLSGQLAIESLSDQ